MPNTEWVKSMPYEELVRSMREARCVVCHAGVGTIMTALKTGHTPVVIPRQLAHGEHVDDHQLDIATQFAEKGLIRCVTSEADVRALLRDRHAAPGAPIGRGRQELRTAVSEAAERGHRRGRRARSRQ
jgi:UDP-N-acetylglucosamine transferase subunit ALG13